MKLSEEIDEKGILKLGMDKVMESIRNLEKENEELKQRIESIKYNDSKIK